MTIQEMQENVDQWIKQHGVKYFHELTNVALLMEEVGEFARLVARQYGEQSFKPGTEPQNINADTADEMADIIFVLVCLANQMHIDLDVAVHNNLVKKTHRDKDRHHQNPKLKS